MFMEKGFNDYLSKPISRPKLDAVLLKWIPQEKQIPKWTGEESVNTAPEGTGETGGNLTEGIEIEGVDSDQGLALSGGSRKVYLEVLAVFSKDTARYLNMIRKIPTESELRDFTTHVHALKSASAAIGAAGISQQAAALEEAGKQGDMEIIHKRVGTFCADLEALAKRIQKARGTDDTNPGESQEIPEAAWKTIEQLREALEGEEYENIEQLLKNLKAMELNTRLRKFIDSISEYILLLELPGAITVIDELQEELAMQAGEAS
jgi:HPt (histidine-containing phosphotransfer) domain-containing protein